MKPIFIPKAKRETIKEQELKLEESKLREDKKIIHDENRKRQVSQSSENRYPAHTLSQHILPTFVKLGLDFG